jgi:hypothetical protein
MTISKKLAGAAIAAVLVTAAGSASAAVTVNFSQSGADVIAVAMGTFDLSLAGLAAGQSSLGKEEVTSLGFFGIGSGVNVNTYTMSGPTTFGSNTAFIFDTSTTGIALGMNASAHGFFIDPNYVSNSAINSTATFANKTLADFGFNASSYSFAAGGNSVSVNIGTAENAAVPEPASWALMILGFGGVGAALRRRAPALA